VYCRKDAKNFGQWRFLSAREIEHGRFRALFAGTFWPKIQNGRTSPKSSKNQSSYQEEKGVAAVSVQPESRTFHRKGCRGRKERKTLPLIHGKPGQVNWMDADS
jgi:hypothetical protein